MCSAWLTIYVVERGHPADYSSKGAPDGPATPYPTPPPHGRGHHTVLSSASWTTPTTRSQPRWRAKLGVAQEPLGLGGVITLALLQQLRGVESEHSFVRDAARFFAHLILGIVGRHPSSWLRQTLAKTLWWVSRRGSRPRSRPTPTPS